MKSDSLLNDEIKGIMLGQVGSLSDQDKQSIISDILTPNGLNLIVTPKEIDEYIENLSYVIAKAIQEIFD